MRRIVVALGVAVAAAGCGKQAPEAPAGPPQQQGAAAPGAPPANAVAPAAANATAQDPVAALEALLRDRVSRHAPSPLWKNRLGRFLVARGQVDEGAMLLDAAAAADPGDADLVLDAILVRQARAGQLGADDAARLRDVLGGQADGPAPGQVAAAPTMAAPPPAAVPGAGAPAPGAMAFQDSAASAPGVVPQERQLPTPAPPSVPDQPPTAAGQPPAMPGDAPPGAAVPAPPPMANTGGLQPPAPTPPTAVGSALAPPTSFDEAVKQAREALQKGDLARAGSLWQDALKFDPKSAQGWVGLADVTLMRGDASAAIDHYKEALRLSPHDTVVAKRLGDACFQTRQNDCAFSAYEVATAAAPVSEDGYVWVRWAHVANQLGKRAIAERALASAEKLLPADDRDLATVRSLLSTGKDGAAP